MTKTDKRKIKMKERITALEFELQNSLQKKTAGKAINVSLYTDKISALKEELSKMK